MHEPVRQDTIFHDSCGTWATFASRREVVIEVRERLHGVEKSRELCEMTRFGNSQSNERIHNCCSCCCWPHQPSVVDRLRPTENELCIRQTYGYITVKLFQVQVHWQIFIYHTYRHDRPVWPDRPDSRGRHVAMAATRRSVCFAFHVLTVKVNKNNKMASPGTCILATFI